MIRRVALIAPAFAVAACTTPQKQLQSDRIFTEATPLCAVLMNPRPYLGKQVLVSGYLTQNPHRAEFWDDGCERGFLPVHESSQKTQDRRLWSTVGEYMKRSSRKPPQVPVVYSGTFTDNSPSLICEGLCSEFTLEGAKLVAVRRS
jgi:hypothetical protein